MLIRRFFVPAKDAESVGLNEVDMEPLGQFVALAGKNGSGKSRLLDLLVGYAATIARRNSAHLTYPREISWSGNPHVIPYRSEAAFKILRYVPRQIDLTDPINLSKGQIHQAYVAAQRPGLDSFHNNCLGYLQELQNLEIEYSHPRSVADQQLQQEIGAKYREISATISEQLGSKLTRSDTGDVQLFGRAANTMGLSEGQKVLLQLHLALHAQKIELNNTVFILDEPENHLHPSALVAFFDSLLKAAPQIQFFIATHSIPLLAYVVSKEPMGVWYMEHGAVSNAGRHPERVLRGLIGDEEAVGRLRAFTALPAEYASIIFAAQSLLPPAVVAATEADPQAEQIYSVLVGLPGAHPLQILDFGAGKGRLLAGLAALAKERKLNAPEVFDYVAFDPNSTDRQTCVREIETIYPQPLSERRYFNSREEFFSCRDERSISVAVMCNVLHEISPLSWLETFGSGSLLFRSLKDDGYLLLVEDQRIPTGEKAHEYGFLLLDTAHLRKLFGVTTADGQLFRSFDCRGDGRLKAHLIGKQLFGRISGTTIREAIADLGQTAMSEIDRLRAEPPTYANGHMHGFWTQQFANASIYLAKTGGLN